MKNLKFNPVLLVITISFGLISFSCGKEKTQTKEALSVSPNAAETKSTENVATPIVNNYLKLKEALVKDDNKAAGVAAKELANAAASFDVSTLGVQKSGEMTDIINSIKEHGEHIASADINHQREHFAMLGNDITDMLTIVGTDRALYKQHCPMYNNNKGADWLSEDSTIKNPYYGTKMLTCGSTIETIK